jgi:hypothetical protein
MRTGAPTVELSWSFSVLPLFTDHAVAVRYANILSQFLTGNIAAHYRGRCEPLFAPAALGPTSWSAAIPQKATQ